MKLRPFMILWLISLAVLSCQNNDSIPRNVLDKAKMQAVMWDIIRADHFLANFVFNRDTSLNKVAESQQLYQRIFKLHKVTKEEFQRSYEYYSTRPKLMKSLMDSVAAMKPVITENKKPQEKPSAISNDTTNLKPVLPLPDSNRKKKAIKNLLIN